MKLRKMMIIALGGASLSGGWAFAQDKSPNDGGGELTMTLITDPEAQLPDAVLNEIVIPGPNQPEASQNASEEGMTHGAEGQSIAAENQAEAAAQAEAAQLQAEMNRQGGLDMAAQAQELGSQLGQGMAESAQQNRESFGRGAGPELDLPDQVPDAPGPPDPPGPPGSPPGPPGG